MTRIDLLKELLEAEIKIEELTEEVATTSDAYTRLFNNTLEVGKELNAQDKKIEELKMALKGKDGTIKEREAEADSYRELYKEKEKLGGEVVFLTNELSEAVSCEGDALKLCTDYKYARDRAVDKIHELTGGVNTKEVIKNELMKGD